MSDKDVLDFGMSLLSDTPAQVAEETKVVEPEQPAQIEVPQTDNAPSNETADSAIEFVIQSDEQVAQPETPSQPADDFEQKFVEKLKAEYGIEPELLKAKLAQTAELEEKANKNVYKTEHGKIFDELAAKGVPFETITKVAFTDLKDADDLQALDIQLQLKHPNLTKEQREAYLDDLYKQGEDNLEKERLAGAVRLKKDADSARAEFSELKTGILQSPVEKQQADFQKAEELRVSAWQNGLAKEVVEKFGGIERKIKLSMSFDGKPTEKEVAFKMPVSQKQKAEMEAFLKESAPYLNNATADAQGKEFALNVLQNKYIVDNLDKIIQGAANNAISFAVEQQKNYLHNYTPPKGNTAVDRSAEGFKSDKEILAGLETLLT